MADEIVKVGDVVRDLASWRRIKVHEIIPCAPEKPSVKGRTVNASGGLYGPVRDIGTNWRTIELTSERVPAPNRR